MKNVILIGDSIRLGYQARVAELLGDGVKVYAPEENCRYTKFALWGMFSWMEGWGSPVPDVIHWNTGIWDLHRCTADGEVFTPLSEYLETNRRLAIQMESYCDRLIWATTIPGGRGLDEKKRTNYLVGESGRPAVCLCDYADAWNADVERYNAANSKMLRGRGIVINDLYSVIAGRTDEYISDDGIHPTEAGYEALARQVAAKIRELL
ncbi:MAG: SGNH/GDSL hydrolase family protein [Clostridia bacterium]|nr:SGNH/GDSL hydrolase family protein [Clostridia bacterium]